MSDFSTYTSTKKIRTTFNIYTHLHERTDKWGVLNIVLRRHSFTEKNETSLTVELDLKIHRASEPELIVPCSLCLFFYLLDHSTGAESFIAHTHTS